MTTELQTASTGGSKQTDYKVIARAYRPQTFKEVLGQDNTVATLKNAIRSNRLAHAYLFYGPRGTGKTTLARILAKALNCLTPTEDGEPCNKCTSCNSIASSSSLDVLEIDGASNRGIDDVRTQINETVSYAASSGKYKIYIIDEVHMLTKEAFNALLKTLEEPPPNVKFFFATTEPQKVLPTIISRCQRYQLHRISPEKIVEKLSLIVKDLQIEIEKEALYLVARMAEGGMRDAESLLDQILSFHDGKITLNSVSSILGLMPQDCLFELDKAGKEGHYLKAFEIVDALFSQGKDIVHFVEMLVSHFRRLLLVKLSGPDAPFLYLQPHEKESYSTSSMRYTQEQCIHILDFLIEAQDSIRFSASPRIALEALLLRIMRTHQRLPIDFLVRRLAELEQKIYHNLPQTLNSDSARQSSIEALRLERGSPSPSGKGDEESRLSKVAASQNSKSEADCGITSTTISEAVPESVSIPEEITTIALPPTTMTAPKATVAAVTPHTLPVTKTPAPPTPIEPPIEHKDPAPIELGARPTEATKAADIRQQSRYDTLLQFAAVELEGVIQKKPTTF